MSTDTEIHDHLELHSLVDGGYVVRRGHFDQHFDQHLGDNQGVARNECAAFTTLAEALRWIGTHIRDRVPRVMADVLYGPPIAVNVKEAKSPPTPQYGVWPCLPEKSNRS